MKLCFSYLPERFHQKSVSLGQDHVILITESQPHCDSGIHNLKIMARCEDETGCNHQFLVKHDKAICTRLDRSSQDPHLYPGTLTNSCDLELLLVSFFLPALFSCCDSNRVLFFFLLNVSSKSSAFPFRFCSFQPSQKFHRVRSIPYPTNQHIQFAKFCLRKQVRNHFRIAELFFGFWLFGGFFGDFDMINRIQENSTATQQPKPQLFPSYGHNRIYCTYISLCIHLFI